MKGQNPDIDATHNFGFCSRSARQLRASGGYVSVFQFSCSESSRPQLGLAGVLYARVPHRHLGREGLESARHLLVLSRIAFGICVK